MAFINPDQIKASFANLATNSTQGKTHSERTSVIFYFLAFDATCKRVGTHTLDFNHETLAGKANRAIMETEFERLSLVARQSKETFQITELGKVTLQRKSPATRISSNFFTVPLKKASNQNVIYSYPKRPSTPVLNLGKTNKCTNWGITYHPEWTKNLSKLFSEAKGFTYFTDLAICIFRDTEIGEGNITMELTRKIGERFSLELTGYWAERIKKEKLLWRPISERCSTDYHTNALMEIALATVNPYEAMTKKQLIQKILELESELQSFS